MNEWEIILYYIVKSVSECVRIFKKNFVRKKMIERDGEREWVRIMGVTPICLRHIYSVYMNKCTKMRHKFNVRQNIVNFFFFFYETVCNLTFTLWNIIYYVNNR